MAFLNQVYNFGRKVLIGGSIVGGVACGADDKKDNPIGPQIPVIQRDTTLVYTVSAGNSCGITDKRYTQTLTDIEIDNALAITGIKKANIKLLCKEDGSVTPQVKAFADRVDAIGNKYGPRATFDATEIFVQRFDTADAARLAAKGIILKEQIIR